MGEITIKTAKFNRSARFTTSSPIWAVAKFLPWLLFLSFMWLNVYGVFTAYNANMLVYGNAVVSIILDIVVYAIIDYLLFLLLLWMYKSILQTKVYFFLTSTRTFMVKIKFWFMIRNLVLGGLYFLLFCFPYLSMYFPILELILSFVALICTFLSLEKDIGVLFKHMYFKSLMYPWFLYQILVTALMLLLGGF